MIHGCEEYLLHWTYKPASSRGDCGVEKRKEEKENTKSKKAGVTDQDGWTRKTTRTRRTKRTRSTSISIRRRS